MKTTLLAPVLACALAAGTAGATTIQVDVPKNVHQAESTLTRAEVIADHHMWRLAGLRDLDSNGDRPVDTNSVEYRSAYETYVQLRASPQFATLARQLQQSPNAVVIARHSTRVAQTRH